jgi:hypothetical protein
MGKERDTRRKTENKASVNWYVDSFVTVEMD